MGACYAGRVLPSVPKRGSAWSVLIVTLAAILAGAAALAYGRFRTGRPALRDFVSFYTGASLARESWVSKLYSLPEQRQKQATTAPGVPFMPYLRPPLLAALLAPLALLLLKQAAVIWLALNAAASLLLGVWCARRLNEPFLLLLFALFTPLLVALNVGQDTPLLVLAVVMSLELLESEQPSAAGLLLGVLWVKPQWLPPFLLLLAARRHWRALTVFAAASAVLAAVSRPLAYARFLREMAALPGIPACIPCMPNLRALLPWLPLLAVATAAVLAVVFVGARSGSLPAAFGLACCAAVLAGYYSHVYDCLLLAPAITIAGGARIRHAARLIFGAALSPLPYLAPYWRAELRLVPALTTLAVFLAYASSAAISSPRTEAYSEAYARENR